MLLPTHFLNRLERDVRKGKLTLEHAYEVAFRRIKPAQARYRQPMKPALEALQAWYEQRAPELGAAVCSLVAPPPVAFKSPPQAHSLRPVTGLAGERALAC